MSLITEVTGYRAVYLHNERKARFAEVQACMEADARALFELELDSCLDICASKEQLETIDDLYNLRTRMRFLASTLGRSLRDDVFSLSWRETNYRDARGALRTLRRLVSENEPIWHKYDRQRKIILRAMRNGTLSLEDLEAKPEEMDEFKRRSECPH